MVHRIVAPARQIKIRQDGAIFLSLVPAMVSIVPIHSPREREAFIRFPWKIYGRNSPWVPPLIKEQMQELDPATGPFFQDGAAQLFLAMQDGEVVGRIAAIINHRHQKAQEEDTGFFGFFECVDDQAVADALLEAAEDWLIDAGMSLARGPASFTIYDPCGVTIKGHELRPGLGMAYTPAYYARLLENAHYRKVRDLHAFHLQRSEANLDLLRLQSRGNDIDHSQFKLRTLRSDQIEVEAAAFAHIFTESWKDNWGAIPMTTQDFMDAHQALKPFIDERLVTLVEHQDQVIGIFLAVPDPWQILQQANGKLGPLTLLSMLRWRKTITHYRVIMMGVLPEYRLSPAVPLMIERFYQAWGQFPNMQTIEFSWILEDNEPMLQLLDLIHAQPLQTFRVYEKFI